MRVAGDMSKYIINYYSGRRLETDKSGRCTGSVRTVRVYPVPGHIPGWSPPRINPAVSATARQDKDIQAQVTERRASWLTTKPLRKPLASNPESAEHSVRELVGRTDTSHDKENVDTLSGKFSKCFE
ncbi:hypothetical protein HF086_002797 [Spodoptera exigua]|uniref:Uncharacterized protein n=1 Tax=Spodoptera exigua TaxID=7107 RepID=A0A922MNU2_SPOEX|nr:hypothetical protein HF086_002797 [Spodoptera exigua]